MSARAQQDRAAVALAAVSCGRLSGAATVRAGRGQALASADQYRVEVTEPGLGPRVARSRGAAPTPEVVYEHWGGDAEMLAPRFPLTGAGGAGGEGAELPMTRALRSWATMESYLRSAAEPCPDSTPIPRGYCVSAFADTMRSGCEGPDAVA